MNERIKELALEARIAYYSKNGSYEGSNDGLSVIPSTQSLEKFAELIVADCVEQCTINFVGTVGTHPNAHNRGVKKCIDNIKQHFGVLE